MRYPVIRLRKSANALRKPVSSLSNPVPSKYPKNNGSICLWILSRYARYSHRASVRIERHKSWRKSVGRDISESVPDEIATIIYERWGDMKSFSVSCDLPYTTVYSILCRSDLRMLDNLDALANALPVKTSADELAEILVLPNMDERTKRLDDKLQKISQLEWSRRSGVPKTTVNRVVNNLEQSQLKDLLTVSRALGLQLMRLKHSYRRSA